MEPHHNSFVVAYVGQGALVRVLENRNAFRDLHTRQQAALHQLRHVLALLLCYLHRQSQPHARQCRG